MNKPTQSPGRVCLFTMVLAAVPSLLFATTAFLPNEGRIPSKVTAVQVSLDGALITHTATLNLKAGSAKLTVDGLAADADMSSLRLAFTQRGLTLLGYQLIPRYPQQEDRSPHMRALADSIEEIQRRTEEEQIESGVLRQEREMILANKSLGGEGSFSVVELEKLAELYRTRLSGIDNKLLQLSRKQQKSGERVAALQRQIDSLIRLLPAQVQQLVLEVRAGEAGQTGLRLTYLSRLSHWTPEYELSTGGVGAPVQLKARARLVQQTGIDWNEVAWTLSTAQARGRTEKPVVVPWILRILQPMIRKTQMYAAPAAAGDQSSVAREESDRGDNYYQAGGVAERQEQTLNVLFQGKEALRLPSGAERLLDLEQRELSAEYRHAVVPRQEAQAYLMARVVGLTALNYLPGRTQLYLDQDLVGETTLYFQQTATDTLDVSLGVDPKVAVQFTAEAPKISESGLTNRIERAYRYRLSVQNRHSRPIKLLVEEAIPFSTHEDISVVDEKLDGARKIGEQGLVQWMLDLGSGTDKTINYSYIVRYPRNKPVGPL